MFPAAAAPLTSQTGSLPTIRQSDGARAYRARGARKKAGPGFFAAPVGGEEDIVEARQQAQLLQLRQGEQPLRIGKEKHLTARSLSVAGTNKKARAAVPTLEPLRGSVLQVFQGQRDQIITQIQLSVYQTDNRAHAAFLVGDAVQHVELRGHDRLGHGGHFDLDGV